MKKLLIILMLSFGFSQTTTLTKEQADNLARTIHRLVEKATTPLEDAVAECEQEVDRLRQRLIKENADG